MIIGIDGNEANVGNKVGIGQYASELLSYFKKASNENLGFRVYLKNHPGEGLPQSDQNWHYSVVKPSKLWTQIGLPIRLFSELKKPDVFFSPTHYAPRISPVPTVISIMDLSYEYYPELFNKNDLYQLKNWTRYSAKNASKIITISEASKNDIMKLYRIPSDKIVVTYLGVRQELAKPSMTKKELIDKYTLSEKYVLFVGTIQPRKNIERLIEAFSELIGSNKLTDTNLVIIGKKGWMFEPILEAPKKHGIESQVKFLDFVPDEDMASFYTHAECFVLPSLYEGFGLPVLEAMRYDCPVLTSNISSLPEAGGDAALYFDPENVHDIAQQIDTVLHDDALREKMRKKGREQIKKFSWEKTAEQTLTVLREVAGK